MQGPDYNIQEMNIMSDGSLQFTYSKNGGPTNWTKYEGNINDIENDALRHDLALMFKTTVETKFVGGSDLLAVKNQLRQLPVSELILLGE